MPGSSPGSGTAEATRQPQPRGRQPDTPCQLEAVVPAARMPSTLAHRLRRLGRVLALNRLRLQKVARDPGLPLRKLRERLRSGSAPPLPLGEAGRPPTVLGLQPGDRVQVRSEEEIASTLDAHSRLGGLAYIPDTMSRFSGGTYTVRKRVDRFFDERSARMLKLKDVVILDDSFCEPPAHMQSDFAGCQRTCFLFWKEGWLKRVDD